MSFIETVAEPEATGATAQMYEAEHERTGDLPNYARVFGDRPQVYQAWQALSTAVSASMDARRYELVTFAAARALRSTYCSVAHGAILAEDHAVTDADLIRLAAGEEVLNERDQAIMGFATKAARAAADITEEDVAGLRGHGLAETEILDIVLATAARCFFSTVLDATGTRADARLGANLAPDVARALSFGRPIAEG